MAASRKALKLINRRKSRVRYAIRKRSTNRPRLSVFRSNQHIHVQVIDDAQGVTLAAASSIEGELKLKSGSNKEAAEKVGELIANRATKAGVKQVVFDRGANLYHGRIRTLAEAARKAGLEF